MSAIPEENITWRALWRLLCEARRVRIGKGELAAIPAVAQPALTKHQRIASFRKTFRRLDQLTYCFYKTCFYRSYLACILGRRLGLPVILNLGVSVGPETRHQAHAWISLKGVIIGEMIDPRNIYPIRAVGNPALCYWFSTPQESSSKPLRKTLTASLDP
jgi:hypothetical protein